jgi:predicted transposase YdaD
MNEGINIGKEIGKAEGIEIGKAEVESRWKAHNIETAKKLRLVGMSLAQISEITGLSVDEINRLN